MPRAILPQATEETCAKEFGRGICIRRTFEGISAKVHTNSLSSIITHSSLPFQVYETSASFDNKSMKSMNKGRSATSWPECLPILRQPTMAVTLA